MKFFKQIRKNALFNGFTDKEIEELFDYLPARIQKYTVRDIVARPTDEINELCIILEGNLVEFFVTVGGDRKVLSSKVDGDMFGVPHCFSGNRRLSTFITAATDVTLLYIDADGIFETEQTNSCYKRFLANLVKYLSEKMLELQQNKDFMAIRGMRKKIAAFIYDKYLEQGGTLAVHLGVDRNGMAKYLNVSRPSMSREMIAMRDELGLFDFRKDLIQIKDLDGLRKIAED